MKKLVVLGFALFSFTALSSSDAFAKQPVEHLCPYSIKTVKKAFSKEFLEVDGAQGIVYALSNLKRDLGACKKVEMLNNGYVEFYHDKHVVPARIEINAVTGLIDAIDIFAPIKLILSNADLQAQASEFTGMHVYIEKNGKKLVAIGEDEKVSIGVSSSAMLLNEVQRQIKAGKFAGDKLVKLTSKDKVQSGGAILAGWPEGAALTLDSLVNFLLIHGDASAFNMLHRIVGRDQLDKSYPQSAPFLNFREMLLLVSDRKQAEHFLLKTKKEERSKHLRSLASMPQQSLQTAGSYRYTNEIGWFATTRSMCAELRGIAGLPGMQTVTGLANPDRFAEIAFVGGELPGVYQNTYLLRSRSSGANYCISVTVNDRKNLPTEQLRGFVQNLMRYLQ